MRGKSIDGDKALNCMFPVNLSSHPENQLLYVCFDLTVLSGKILYKCHQSSSTVTDIAVSLCLSDKWPLYLEKEQKSE